jgi:hypothetical protein
MNGKVDLRLVTAETLGDGHALGDAWMETLSVCTLCGLVQQMAELRVRRRRFDVFEARCSSCYFGKWGEEVVWLDDFRDVLQEMGETVFPWTSGMRVFVPVGFWNQWHAGAGPEAGPQ